MQDVIHDLDDLGVPWGTHILGNPQMEIETTMADWIQRTKWDWINDNRWFNWWINPGVDHNQTADLYTQQTNMGIEPTWQEHIYI